MNPTQLSYLSSCHSLSALIASPSSLPVAEMMVKSYNEKSSTDHGGYRLSLELEGRLARIVTQDQEMLMLKDWARVLWNHTEYPICISGPTGTGKELFAKALASESTFVAINCAGLPEHLIESELFGHVKGAFTGAIGEKIGLFQAAGEGVVFLDEVGELPKPIQAKLLRVLQEKTIRPVGGNIEIPIKCRVICATHHDISCEENFRSDLYCRLAVFCLNIPPYLPERWNDVKLLMRSLDDNLKEEPLEVLGEKAREQLMKGNARTIEHWVARWKVLGEKGWLL